MRKSAIGIMCALALAAAGANTWWVEDEGGVDAAGRGSEAAPFQTIQYAIDTASAGDTIWVKPGVYDKGGAESTNTTTHLNRVVLKKKVYLKSTGGAAVTHIVGAPDPDTADGVGPKGVRCMIAPSDNSALGATISGFTLRDGYGDVDKHRSGGFLQHHGRKEIYISDCVISNCMSYSHGGARGGTFSRCLFANNRVTTGNHGNDAAGVGCSYLVHCVIVGNGDNNYDSAVGDSSTLVNCTVVCNRGNGCSSSCTLYNTVVCGNSTGNYKGSNATDCAIDGYPVYSPLDGDLRIVVGSAADGAGNPAHLQQGTRPFTMSSGMETMDFAGNTVDASAEHVHVGAIQATTQAATEGGTLYLYGPLSSNGLHVPNGVPTYGQSTNCLTQWRIRFGSSVVSGAKTNYLCDILRRHGESSNGQILYVGADDTRILMVPPKAGLATTNTPEYCKGRWVDANSGSDTAGDGSEARPYETIQKAIDEGGPSTVIFLAPGVYGKGGAPGGDASVAPYMATRVWLTNHYTRIVGKAGAAQTIIVGAPDPATGGMGDAAVRCAASSTSYATMSGVTLSNGWTRVDDSNGGHGAAVLGNVFLNDCVVTGCHGYESVFRNSFAYGCRVYGNESLNASLFDTSGRVVCSWIGPNKSKSSSYYGYIGSSVSAYFSTFVMEDGKSIFSQNAYIYNCIAVGGQYVKRAMNSKGNLFWNFSSVEAGAAGTFANPRLRRDGLHVPITSPALAAGVVPNAAGYEASDPISRNWHVYCHADVEGNPIRFNTDGTAMVGASQNPVPVRTAFTVSLQ